MMNRVQLLGLGHREPELDQVDARADEHALQLGRLPHELQVLGPGAETHDPLDAGPVVPGPVEQHDLARSRQVGDVALEVPLAASRSLGFSSATTVAPRGLRCSMKRLIVPPLPAASRPSKTMTSLCPVSFIQFCSLSSSIWSSRLIRSYSCRGIRSSYG